MQANTQNWQEDIKVVASDGDAKDYFGIKVSISGNYGIVGAMSEGSCENHNFNEGAAYIFKKGESDDWYEYRKIVASDRDTNNWFGKSVSINGNYAIVGAQLADEDEFGENYKTWAGAAYIFELSDDGSWNQVQKIVASDRTKHDHFGSSVSISGNYAIVGAIFEDEDPDGGNTLSATGSAYIYERNGSGNWIQVQKIVASDREALDSFGCSASISGNYAIVGAIDNNTDVSGENNIDNSGSAYFFERNEAGTWSQIQKVVDSYRGSRAKFGHSVSISENYAVVGAPNSEVDANGWNPMEKAGSACIFERNENGLWSFGQRIVGFDRAYYDGLGCSVSIGNIYAVLGSDGNSKDENGENYMAAAGAVYIFKRSAAGDWLPEQKVVASDRSGSEYFGTSVSTDGNNILTGAYLANTEDNEGNIIEDAGAAYFIKQDYSSIGENDFSIALTVSPNPTLNNVIIDLGKIFHKVEVRILNVFGQLISSKQFNTIQSMDLEIIGKTGLYFVEIRTSDNKYAVVKILKE